jgi:hypothetical protein
MYAYIAWDLLTNLETFSTLIDFQKKCYGKYTPKYVFLLLVYMCRRTGLDVTQRDKTKKNGDWYYKW